MAHCLVDPDEAYEERRDNEAGFNDWPQDTWRDLKKDPPELRKPVLVTDGVSVYFGQMARYADNYDTLFFEGVDIGESDSAAYGAVYSCLTDELMGWQPAPGYQPQKTAEQMFRGLGYTEKRVHSEYGETSLSNGPRCHVKKRICYDRNLNFTKHMRISVTCESNTFTKDEILACARLIEEMGAEK